MRLASWFHTIRRAALAPTIALGALLACAAPASAQTTDGATVIITFKRGDVNANGTVDLVDTFALLDYFYAGVAPPVACDDAFDINDDGAMGVSDAIALLAYQFTSGASPATPFDACGEDTSADSLTCVEYPGCDPIVIDTGPTPEELAEMAQITHALRRMAYGQTPALFDRVFELEGGLEAYIEEQLDPASIDESGTSLLNTLLGGIDPDANIDDLYRKQIFRGLYSERQLQEVLTDFWDNHFNTYLYVLRNFFLNLRVGGAGVYTAAEANALAARYEEKENEAFRQLALGSFEDLLRTSATSVTMLVYLDSIVNVKGIPNENYAREILELHTMGVDNGYVQADIVQLAKVFTGWTVCLKDMDVADDPLADCEELTLDPGSNLVWAFHFDASLHDFGAKTIFAGKPYVYSIPADASNDPESGLAEGLGFIEYMATRNQTAEYLSTKLVQRFVVDEAPAGLVADLMDVWLDNDGDMGAVVAALLDSEEFLGEEFRNSKVCTPWEYVLSTIRAFDGETDEDASEIRDTLSRLGNVPFNFGTPDGYPEKADDQLGTARLLDRVNFNKYIWGETDMLEFDNIRSVMRDHDVDLNSVEEVVTFWMRRVYGGLYDDTDRQLGELFLGTDDEGDEQRLAAGANLYNRRVRKFLTFLASFPQGLKQ